MDDGLLDGKSCLMSKTFMELIIIGENVISLAPENTGTRSSVKFLYGNVHIMLHSVESIEINHCILSTVSRRQ